MNNENPQLAVERYAIGRENKLIAAYILDGPKALRSKLEVGESEWQAIFDYLVFQSNLVYKSVITNKDVFLDEYIRNGTSHVREMLGILDEKYDDAWEVVFDFLAISNEGLYYHVLHHRTRYVQVMRKRGSDFIRKVLGVIGYKYEENWGKVLDYLLNAVCDDLFTERTYEHGLKAFSLLVNGMREHRPIFKSGILI